MRLARKGCIDDLVEDDGLIVDAPAIIVGMVVRRLRPWGLSMLMVYSWTSLATPQPSVLAPASSRLLLGGRVTPAGYDARSARPSTRHNNGDIEPDEKHRDSQNELAVGVDCEARDREPGDENGKRRPRKSPATD
jgi:hypothetical protein